MANVRAQIDAGLDAFERAAAHAQRAGLQNELMEWRSVMRFNGTTPVSEVLTWLNEQGERAPLNPTLRGCRANVLAMLGRFDEARATLAEVRAELADRGGGTWLATLTGMTSLEVELLAGDPEAAVAFGAEGCRQLDELGERGYLSTAAGGLAQAFYALGRLEEADAWAGRAAELGASDDLYTQILWRQVRAKVLARYGDFAEAERLAREAVAIGERTDMLDQQGSTHADLAEVLSLAGRSKEAAEALEQALARYNRKGNLVAARRIAARRAELRTVAPR